MLKCGSLDKAIKETENTNRDLYFYVNGYATINEVRSHKTCFVDLDAGRGSDNKYLPARQVNIAKAGFLKQIGAFPLTPTWIVETRNGYQVYWVLKESARRVSRIVWNGLQKKLANHFGGDTLAIKPNQLLRVPFTWWQKPWESKAPFFSSLLDYDGSGKSVYTIEELQKALSGVSTTVKHNYKKCSKQWHTHTLNDVVKNCKTVTVNNSPTYTYVAELIDEHLDADDSKNQLLVEAVEFIKHASKTLYYSGNKYLSSQGYKLAEQIANKFCIG
jgi:hypothetical protein